MTTVHLMYISQDLRVVVQEVSPDGKVSPPEPMIFTGDHYGTFDDPGLVQISISTQHEGVYRQVAEGRDPGGAPAYIYVREELLANPVRFHQAILENAAEDDQ
jgi:hypothetical protein